MIPLRLHRLLVPLFLLVFFAQAASAWRLKAPTFDEPTHLAAGWSYLKSGRFMLNPEHPPLLKQWAALPMLTMRLGEPADYRGWDPFHQGTFAHLFFFSGNDFKTMFWLARLMMVGLAVLLGVWIYAWSRELWGPDGALLSLFLFAYSPNLLAHSGVVATDYGLASFGVMSLWLWARMLAYPSIPRTLLAGVATGLVFLAKFSAITLPAVWLGWWVLVVLTRGRFPSAMMPGPSPERFQSKFQSPWPSMLGFWAGRLLMVAALAFLLVLADYNFQIGALRAGLDHLFGHLERGHPAYFRGKISVEGWWYFFPVAYLIKTPIPELLLIALAWIAWLKSKRGWMPWALLVLPYVFVLATGMASRLSIGYRHILMMVPLGIVMAGAAISLIGRDWKNAPIAVTFGALLLLWQAWGSISIWPNHLTYFNEIAGGPKKGHRWLTDSNLDWGQDLSTLAQFMEQNNISGVYLSYFGTASPRAYGIRYARLPGYNSMIDPVVEFDPERPAPGTYAIFATNLTGQYLADPDTFDYFRQREPVAVLGNSVFVYYVGSSF